MKKKRFVVLPLWLVNTIMILGMLFSRDRSDLFIKASIFVWANLSTTFARTWEQWMWAKTWHGGKLDKQ